MCMGVKSLFEKPEWKELEDTEYVDNIKMKLRNSLDDIFTCLKIRFCEGIVLKVLKLVTWTISNLLAKQTRTDSCVLVNMEDNRAILWELFILD
jgi:hypothetical protein